MKVYQRLASAFAAEGASHVFGIMGDLDAHHMDSELATVPTPDLGAIATACGGRGRLARSIEELRAAVAEWVAKPGPMMIDLRISRSVVTIPYRRIHYGRDE